MPTETENKAPSKPPKNIDRFKPDMPHIPGLDSVRPGGTIGRNNPKGNRLAIIGGSAAAALLVVVVILWWTKSATRHDSSSESSAPEATILGPTTETTSSPAPASEGPTVVGTAEELAKPWSSKKFRFVKPFSRENVDAIVIRLPGKTLWAFALQEPYGHCELEFVTDLGRLAKQYGYHASHPMVANPCNNTLYDPLKVGPLGDSVWVRGEIVQGEGLRPPLSINVQEKGRSIVADRME